MYAQFGKRTLDIIFAAILLALGIIPLILVALLIKLDSKGPAIFKQQRYGRDAKPFTIYKFRSMAAHAPSDRSTAEFTDSVAYITKLGRIIRKLSIDELPQLINVLKGDMSFVGPRPLVLSEKSVIKLREKVNANSVRPGISGWAQANGRDEMDDATKAEYDGEYVANFGLEMDIRCVLKTIHTVVSGAGHAEGHEQVRGDDADVKEVA